MFAGEPVRGSLGRRSGDRVLFAIIGPIAMCLPSGSGLRCRPVCAIQRGGAASVTHTVPCSENLHEVSAIRVYRGTPMLPNFMQLDKRIEGHEHASRHLRVTRIADAGDRSRPLRRRIRCAGRTPARAPAQGGAGDLGTLDLQHAGRRHAHAPGGVARLRRLPARVVRAPLRRARRPGRGRPGQGAGRSRRRGGRLLRGRGRRPTARPRCLDADASLFPGRRYARAAACAEPVPEPCHADRDRPRAGAFAR
ncbi:hypothetical protein D3C86_1427970 [compost metagenome]